MGSRAFEVAVLGAPVHGFWVPKDFFSCIRPCRLAALLGRRSGGTRRIVEGSSAGRVDQSGAASAGELAVTRRAQLEEFGVALLAV